ncbi:MAG: DUF2142 domain-containing protein [Chloroflexota bacterium]
MTSPVRVRVALGLIVAGYLVLAVLYATRVPIWNAPDEPAHFNFIRAIAVDNRLPILKPGDYNQDQLARLMHDHFASGESIASLRYESHQPPLYYLIATPVFLATERFDTRTQVIVLRLLTALIGALVVLATYRLATLTFPGRATLGLGAAAFVAFVPMHVFMDAAIDNDALVELMIALVLIVLVDDLRKPKAPRNDVLVGIAAGLAALAKLDGGVCAVLIVAGFLGSAFLSTDRPRAIRRAPRRIVRAGIVAALISGWWFARNLLVYGLGDPFALRRHAQVVVGQPLTGALTRTRIRDLALTAFHSFWGQFGWMGIPYADRTYDVIAALSLLVALGVGMYLWRLFVPFNPKAWAWIREGPTERLAVALLLLEVLLVIVGVVFYNLRYLQPQGRYFFPALPALAILSVAGIGELIRDEHRGLVIAIAGCALYGLCVFSLFQVIGPAFAAAPSP